VGIVAALGLPLGCGSAAPGSAPTSGDAGAGDRPVYSGTHPIKTVCTTGMVADVVREVGGDRVDVVQLMGEGVDPHLYKASPGDVSRLRAADIIFYSGLHLEGKMAEIFELMSRRKPTFAVTEGLPEDRILMIQGSFPDPHLWFDVSLWSETVNTVRDRLAAFDPPRADEYRNRAEKYRAELAALHAEAQRLLDGIPAERRVLVTAHDAFHYFGRAYGVEVRAIQGISTESEAGVKEINELVHFLTERKIKAVFVETSVGDRNIKSLVEGCRQAGHEVAIGGELFSDAMGKPGTEEGTYIGMVRHNVNTIVQALK
jgi:manganese/zinc/iron transport system substrate-binding protein